MKQILFVTISLIFSLNVQAGDLICSGKVETIAYHGNDRLMVKLDSMNVPVFFCNPNVEWTAPGATGQVMGPETCKAVFSILLSARVTGEKINRIHFDGDSVPENCDEFVSWQRVFIRYINY